MCTKCGQFVDDWHGVAFEYVQEGLMLTRDEITRLKDTNTKKLFDEKKLQLVIDLDHTLLHSKSVEKLTPKEKYLENIQTDSGGGGLLYKLETPERMVKLRPFVRNFLKEPSTMFELYIFTMGSEFYAKQMAQLLDHQGNYFENRVISKDDLIDKGKKTLDLVLGQESGIIILDDDENVWPDHKENLITIFPYLYFSEEKRKRKSYSEMKKDASNGALVFTIKFLRGIHGMFFNRNKSILPCNRDVRILMRILQSKVLKGCVIFFSGVDDDDECKECSDFVVKAKELGAECIDTLDSSSVTHVVSWTKTKAKATEDIGWAKKEKKFLVNQRWVYFSYLLWNREDEYRFPVVLK
ncbi:hypothetical protein EZV62_022943 [Acer yangbiense]|uniref:RNA polymerase II C-terminal domain phosphatase-like n=1 Tax=Acer yangbiense TaxID=1000413 RepID=A0A5C7H0R4_9ROSI|nr:hypothetical protein EZV62_022943 [Acer yangbiense]